MLANFPIIPKKGLIIDLCAGNGAIGLFISQKTPTKIVQIELQKRLASMGKRSIQLNHLENQLTMVEKDLKEATQIIKPDSVDLLLCNPPYFKELPTSQKNPNPYLAIARHEICTNLKEVIETSAKLLKTNGRLAMVHRPDRFLSIIKEMQTANIAPKRVRFVYPKIGKEAHTILIEGIKQGKEEGFRVLSPLYIYDENNNYTEEMSQMIYGK